MSNKFITLTLSLSFISFFGCSNRPSDMPVLYPCTITVTQDGTPLAEASVMLINVSEPEVGNAWAPMAKTDSGGIAVMHTNSQYQGVPTGKYHIIVDKIETEPSKLGPPPSVDSPGYEAWAQKNADEKLAQYILVETIYSSSQTPHEIEVGKGTNNKTIDVGKAVKIKR